MDRARHGGDLRRLLDKARTELARRAQKVRPVGIEAPKGFYLEFESPPGFELKLESLESKKNGVELVAVRHVDRSMLATAYVPQGGIAYFMAKVEEYLTATSASGKPKYATLIESIAAIRLAVAESFWTDDPTLLPDPKAVVWWEVWLRGADPSALERFQAIASAVGLAIGTQHLAFPERTVVLARGTLNQLAESVELLDTLAELRRPKDVGSFFTRITPKEQRPWAADLGERTTPPEPQAPAVCILDTGVAQAHPLLARALDSGDMHAYHPDWGVHDHHGHGTEMAGIALYGDLKEALASTAPVHLGHRLESVKILPPHGSNRKDLYGAVTAEAVGRAELQAPERPRVITIAVTARDAGDRGQPTSWSGKIDDLAAGVDGGEPRLLFLAAGNVAEPGLQFRERNETEEIHDPAQAWNALTVGAYTEQSIMDEPSDPSSSAHKWPPEVSHR